MSEFLALDVECAASGWGHNDRVPVRMALVNLHGGVLVDKVILPTVPIFDSLEQYTGLRSDEIFETGEPMEEVQEAMQAHLGPHVTLIGQRVQFDADWLELRKGTHYRDVVDLADVFKRWSQKRNHFVHFSLQEAGCALLGQKTPQTHDPATDAKTAMALFVSFVLGSTETSLARTRARLLNGTRRYRSERDRAAHGVQGAGGAPHAVCHSKFNGNTCTCGQRTFDKDTACISVN